MATKTAALSIPILPHTSPEAPQPNGLILPLHNHQLRALHRCLLIEQNGGALTEDFHDRFDYKSKGGCLADEVGTGKTATSIGLILSGDEGNGGDTLVVAPSHLILQWRDEIFKFCGPTAIQVLVGKDEYESKATLPPPPGTKRVVLIDVDTILQEPKVWYDFRRIYDSDNKRTRSELRVSPDDLEKYKQAAKTCVRSPKGPCSYEGWVYTGSLHHPVRPWRRVIFDEIQDLVVGGTVSQKNLLQLSRTAPHVWLLSATPFPHGNESIYANHELLGFCRLRLQVDLSQKLPPSHPFEKIKRKLYIKSPRHVAEEAVKATKSVVINTLTVEQLQVEKTFYQMELSRIQDQEPSASNNAYFGSAFASLREMTVHPEASQELREQAMGKNPNNAPTDRVGQFASVGSFAKVSLSRAKIRQTELNRLIQRARESLHATKQSLKLAQRVKDARNVPVTANPFAGPTVSDTFLMAQMEQDAVHKFYCGCTKPGGIRCRADRQVHFRIIPNEETGGVEWIRGSMAKVVQYFQEVCHPTRQVSYGTGALTALDHYISTTNTTVTNKERHVAELENELSVVRTRVQMLGGTISPNTNVRQQDLLASTHGSKPAALVRFLRDIEAKGEQAIVFSYWHDTLRLVQRTLQRCELSSSFCDGRKMAQALVDFTSGKVSFLLLSAQAKASGTNLQCASHVILLDPAGSSAEHGAALEQQAIGRAVRMGQDKPVVVTRFCVTGTIEEDLFHRIDSAALTSRVNSNDSTYVIEGAHMELPVTSHSAAGGDKVDDSVQVTKSISATERIQREFVQAKEKGLIVDLLGSDAEDASPTEQSPIAAPKTGTVRVKVEPTFTDKKRPASEVVSHSSTEEVSPSKRIRENEKEVSSDSPSSVTGGAPVDAEAVTPEQTATVSPSSTRENVVRHPELTSNSAVISRSSSIVGTTESSQEDSDSAMSQVKKLLERCHLSVYEAKFQEKGYDCLDWLYDISSDVVVMEKLASDVGFLPGHAIRFQHLLSKEAGERKLANTVSTFSDV